MKKKILTLSAILIIAICSMIFCISASAEVYEGTCGAAATWSLDTETKTLTISGTGEMYDYRDAGSNNVAPWFSRKHDSYICYKIETVVISEGITYIGNNNFYCYDDDNGAIDNRCPPIKNVYLPSTLKRINNCAFGNGYIEDCYGGHVYVESEVNIHIPNIAFWLNLDWCNGEWDGCGQSYNLVLNGNNLTEITIPYSVTNIREYAFHNILGITKVTLPYSIESIGNYAFDGCTELTSVNIPDSVTSIGDYAFRGCTGLTSVTIPDSVTNLGIYAFSGCTGLTSVNIPDSVTSIGKFAFYGCTGLTSVNIPASVTSIGDRTFYDCSSLTSIEVDENNEYYCDIDGVLFTKDKKTLVAYPAGGAITYAIPDSVTSIGNWAFSNCGSLTSVTIPDSVTSIGNYAFYNCSSLTRVTIPDSVTSIGNSAFSSCSSLTSVTIGESVTSIGDWAFDDCSSLTSVTIGDSVTSIGYWAFDDCSNLKNLHINDLESWLNVKLSGSYSHPLYSAGGNLYIDGVLATDIEIPDTVSSVSNYAFYNCDSITSVTIPDSVTSIGSYAFEGCSSLANVIIPDSVTSIGDDAFYGCNNIEAFYVTKDSYAESWLKSNGYGSIISYGLAIAEDTIIINVGESVALTSTIIESIIDTESVVWSSDNKSVATVENGVITAKSVGTAIITLSANNGTVSDSCTVTIIPSLPTTADEFLTFEGYQLRENKYNGLRSRFVVNLANMPKISTHGYTVIEYGTVIASSDFLDKNGDELTVSKNAEGDYATLSYATIFPIRKNGSYVGKYESKDANELVYFCTVTKFNEKTYDLKVEIRGYAVIVDSEGNEYVIYADYPDEEYRSVSLKQMCLEMASEGLIDTTTCISYLHVVQFMEESGKYGDNEVDGDEFFEEY